LHGAFCDRSEVRKFISLDGGLRGWSGFEKNLEDKGHLPHVLEMVSAGEATMQVSVFVSPLVSIRMMLCQ